MVAPTAEGVAIAARAIQDGLLVVYPTETVYGLGANPFSVEAMERVFRCKGRMRDVPLPLIAADLEQVMAVVESLGDAARRYAETFWPGPLGLLLPRSDRLPDAVTAGRAQVSVRVPAHDTARALCRETGHPIVSTSANASGAAPARSLDELTLAGIAVAIDGGLLPDRPPSTIFDPETNTIVRPGAIDAESLARISHRPTTSPSRHSNRGGEKCSRENL